jgi:hypothetical protein
MMNVVVDQGGQQVVRERNGGEVPGEVQVDVLHRHYLRVTAAGSTALLAEHRSESGLAQADDCAFADVVESVAETDRGRGLAFTGRRR